MNKVIGEMKTVMANIEKGKVKYCNISNYFMF